MTESGRRTTNDERQTTKGLLPLIALAILFLPACAREPARVARGEFAGKRTASAIVLENSIKRYRLETQNVRALASILFGDSAEERQTGAAVVVSRPASIRVDAMDPLADVWAKAGSDGKTMWLYLPAKSKLYSGGASQSNLRRLTKFDFELPELLNILTGAPPTDDNVKLLQAAGEKGHFFVEGAGIHLWTKGKDFRVVKIARFADDASEVDYTVAFGDFRKAGGVAFPHRVEARIPGRGARIVVVYKDVSLGGGAQPDAFRVPETGRAKVQMTDDR